MTLMYQFLPGSEVEALTTILRGMSVVVVKRLTKILSILKWHIQIEEKIESLPCTKKAMLPYLIQSKQCERWPK